MDKPVAIAVDGEKDTIYVVTEAGHVFMTRPGQAYGLMCDQSRRA
jgi:hypothetical protein